MKKLYTLLTLAALSAVSLTAQLREHRGVWWSSIVLGEWPNTAITERNVDDVRYKLGKQLDKLEAARINTIYFHVRGNCDAMYNSAYEPWAKMGASPRGNAPYADPFQMIIEDAHARGIEVYAWVNPYRYQAKQNPDYPEIEKEYKYTKPEWLLSNKNGTVLNPGIPEVKQRIADVCADIVTKYDVDGLIFDDYFYYSGMEDSMDAELYNKYKKKDEPQADWRRRNVNEMVELVNTTIKTIKPYLTFEIGPAGVANHPDGKYPIPDSPSDGYQYNNIYSDPVAWLEAKTIDVISPQIYWLTTANYLELSDWWSIVAKHYGRHSYTSIDISEITTIGAAEFIKQIEYNREVAPLDQSGIAFFSLERLNGYREKYNGEPIDDFTNILARHTYPTFAVNPLLQWKGERRPVAVRNLVREGNEISWTKDDNMRYVIYSVPAEVADPKSVITAPEYTVAVRYGGNYSIPAGQENNTFAVAAYDRYGYIYTPYIVGAPESSATAPKLLYPANGEKVTMFETLKWEKQDCPQLLQIATDPEMKNVILSKTEKFSSLDLLDIPTFDQTVEYYWQVVSLAPNAPEAGSEIRTFSVRPLKVNAMTEPIPLAPEISWESLGDGVSYTVEIAYDKKFGNIVFSGSTDDTRIKVPEGLLMAYTEYYVRINAIRGNTTVTSDAACFRTLEMTFTSAPEFITPASDGATLHSNEKITVSPIAGVTKHSIQIAASSSFPSRSTTTVNGTETAEASALKVASKLLENGKTYYTRSFATYSSSAGSSVKTPYSAVRSFVYSSEAGVEDIAGDCGRIIVEGNRVTLPERNRLEVFDIAGRLVLSLEGTEFTLSLRPGAYILKACGETVKAVL